MTKKMEYTKGELVRVGFWLGVGMFIAFPLVMLAIGLILMFILPDLLVSLFY